MSLPTPHSFATGDKVRHRQRPEWGTGAITKIETITLKGSRDQRIWIRFPNAGLKTVLASVAPLDRVPTAGAPVGSPAVDADDETLVGREARQEGGWLGAIAKRQPEDAMTSLPAAATDPFLSLDRRLEFILGLYRFEPVGGKLVDWAVAQSGLDDPLSRFNRQQLETFFSRWSFDRDVALHRVVQEVRNQARVQPDIAASLESRIAKAPASAQAALRRLSSPR
jgi:hypothetical protein